ncbi:N(4)-(beta-N-acetylglucosaminyl)-L-asparaginase [Halpernia frigidisoli]|uniref:N4-(Beta-N-acetylglucosaminyl)-L-asparaginase n=1 Tax=Halpernia frigidisoli TaxID=1125876 RepID=A0A1I3FWS3_9FLAO|nr:N(4)-(beta-N-acetylglucosaminyl)-L-asparaginase [Halpernia frigidisoli]SFI15690.1 N4-(beta-N-acetylglucosaminyl)-L-asparaginase [Halpernia frigidisoli]
MSNRRKFLKNSAIASTTLLLNPFDLFAKNNSLPTKKLNQPIVISTWDFGVEANKVAFEILSKGGKSLDAVEKGVRLVEDDPNERSVGFGGRPDRDGKVTLDACIMDENANIGSVACLENIKNPISVARAVMEKTPHVMLVSEGAFQFALSQGFKKQNLLTPESEKEWKEWLKTSQYKPIVNIENHDTIGMIAMDKNGDLSGACTTSGMAYKMHGRVGDSPIIGAGLFVDNEIGAATATGQGEEVIRTCGTHLVVELMRQGKSPQDACEEAVKRILKLVLNRKKNPKDIQIGFIALNKNGETGGFCLQKGFNYAVQDQSGSKLIPGKFLI